VLKNKRTSEAGTMLKVESMEREQARIDAIRARNEARRERCLNARSRTIGVDVAALEAQIKEKEESRKLESSESMAQAERDRFINKLIEQRELEEREMKRVQMEEQKMVWEQQRSRGKNQAPRMGDPVVAEECGLGAVQRFSGEDSSRIQRMRMQQQQMRSWTKQQMEERSAKEREEKDEDVRYAAYLRMLAEKRQELEGDEVVLSRENAMRNRKENEYLAEQLRLRHSHEKQVEAAAKVEEVENMMNSAFLCEDTSGGLTPEGRIVKDRYKGLTREQIREMYRQNEQLITQKKASNGEDDREWRMQQIRLEAVLAQSEVEQNSLLQSVKAEQRDYLQKQIAEHEEKKRREREEKFGAVENEFFNGFGTSWR